VGGSPPPLTTERGSRAKFRAPPGAALAAGRRGIPRRAAQMLSMALRSVGSDRFWPVAAVGSWWSGQCATCNPGEAHQGHRCGMSRQPIRRTS